MKLRSSKLPSLKKLVAVLTIGFFVVACSKHKDANELIQDAKQAESKGDNKAAIIQLKNALQEKPDNAEARYLLGLAYNRAGDANSAEKEFRRALELKFDPVMVMPNLGKSLLMQGEFKKVLAEIGAEAGDNIPADLLSIRGLAQLSTGKYDEAKGSFDRALQKSPGLPDALLGQARLAVIAKDINGGIKLVDQALEKTPDYLDGLVLKGDLLRLKNNHQEALDTYKKIVAKYPENLPVRFNIASIHINNGNFDEAIKELEGIKKLSPNAPMLHYMQGLIAFKKKDYQKARENVLQVLKVAPNHLPSQLLAGATEYFLGSYAQAEQYLKFVIERTPNNLYARRLLIVALLKTHQIPRAIDILQPALIQAPEDPALLALAGEVYMQSNDFAKASQYYEKAAKIDPKNAQMRTGLGLSRLASGDADKAMVDLEAATDLDANKFQADVTLIMYHLGRQEYDKADKAVAALKVKQPKNPLTYNLEGAVFIGRKKSAEARKSFEQALALQPSYFPASMNLAQIDLQEKNPAGARKHLDAVLKKEPNHLQALLALASMGSQINATSQEILDWLMTAKKGNPSSPQPIILLTRYYLNIGDAKKAMELASEAQAVAPDNPEVMDLLGTVQLATGEKNAAISTFSKLVELQPKSPVPLVRLANAQYANDNVSAATASLRKALEIKSDLLEALTAMVAIETRSKRYEEAMQIVKKIQSQPASGALGFVLEGDVSSAQRKYPQAAVAYEKAYNITRSGPVAIKLHAALTQSGKPDEGEVHLLNWLKDNPNDLTARIYFADAYLKRQKYKAAIEQYEWINKVQPQNIIVLNNLAFAYQQIKDPRALKIAEQAYKIAPKNAAIIDTYGWMLVEQKQYDKGIELLQQALSASPDQQEIRFHYASALYQSGKKDQARIELERILSSGIKFPQEKEATELLKRLK